VRTAALAHAPADALAQLGSDLEKSSARWLRSRGESHASASWPSLEPSCTLRADRVPPFRPPLSLQACSAPARDLLYALLLLERKGDRHEGVTLEKRLCAARPARSPATATALSASLLPLPRAHPPSLAPLRSTATSPSPSPGPATRASSSGQTRPRRGGSWRSRAARCGREGGPVAGEEGVGREREEGGREEGGEKEVEGRERRRDGRGASAHLGAPESEGR